MMKRILKYAAAIAAGFLGILLLLGVLTQTQFFRNRLRAIIMSSLADRMNGTIELGRIGGNFVQGFTIDSLAIRYGDRLFLTTSTINCRYDPLAFLQKKLLASALTIEKPAVHFYRSMDGEWNFSHLFKPDTGTGPSSFDWALRFEDVQLHDGLVTVDDSASLGAPDHWTMPASYFEYHRFSIHDLALRMSLDIEPNGYAARILDARCISPESGLELRQLRGEFKLSPSGITASDVLIRTRTSSIRLDASLHGVDIRNGIDLARLQRDSTVLRLTAAPIDLAELRSYIPQVSFLDGSATVSLEASGKFGDLAIRRCRVETFSTALSLTGRLRNLHEPSRLEIDATVANARIFPSDAARLLPPLGLPSFTGWEPLALDFTFSGRPANFRTKAFLRGEIGSIDFNGTLNLEDKVPAYAGSFVTRNLSLGQVLGNRNVRSALTMHGTIDGRGFATNDLAGKIDATIDSSRFQNASLDRSTISLVASPHHVEGSALLVSSGMKAELRAHCDFADTASPAFGGDVALTSFDLARFLNDARYESDLTLDGAFSGSGTTIDDFTGEGTLTLRPSLFHGHRLPGEELTIALDQSNRADKRLSMRSSIADVDLKGRFDLDLAGATIGHQMETLVRRIEEHAMPTDSTQPAGAPEAVVALRRHTLQDEWMDFTYTMAVKDLEPLATILEGTPFNARATLTGRIANTSNNLSISCQGTLDEFFVGSVKGGLLLTNGTVNLVADSLSDENTLEKLSGGLDLRFAAGLLNRMPLNDVTMKIRYDRTSSSLAMEGLVDSTYSLQTVGSVSIQPHTYVIDLDSLMFSSGPFQWENDQDIQCRLNNDGIRVMHSVMKRKDETLTLTGVLHPSGALDIDAAARKVKLDAIDMFSRKTQMVAPGEGFSGEMNAELHLAGSLKEPVITFRAVSESTYFRESRIGLVNAMIDYSDRMAHVDVSVRGAPSDSVPSLTIQGKVPIDLGLAGVEERFPNQEQAVRIVSEGFDLSVLDPILPDIDRLSGSLRCNVSLGGTPQDPEYQGSITLSDVRFILTPNNVGYIVAGDLEPSGNRIIFQNVSLKNFPEKGLRGETILTGSVLIRDFQISEFDLTATGQILLMTDASRKTIPSMYGTLFGETAPEGLRITGTLANPYLSGKVYVREANLIFPPTKPTETSASTQTLKYTVRDDTTKLVPRRNARSKFFAAGDTLTMGDQMEFSPGQSPLLERIRYDLSIETRGTTAIKMIFTPTTNEELYAELDGKVNAVNHLGTALIYGDIEISPRSYYNFIRRFDATGKLKFVGQWDNPELDIQATYEGYRPDPAHDTLEQKVIVQLNIKGTRYEPKLDMGMQVELRPGEDPVDWSTQAKGGDVQSDAISFIVTGKFRDQLTSKDQQTLSSSLGTATGGSVASTLLSGIMTDVLKREFPWIRRAEVTYQGGNFQQGANVNVSASVGKGYLRVGGKILNDIGNANVSYQLNLGDFFNTTTIRNLFLEIQRKVEGENPEVDKKLTNEARLYYRFSF